MGYLLDTNSWVDLLRRGAKSKVSAKLATVPSSDVWLCAVVVGELIFGAVRSGAANEQANRNLIVGLQAQFASLPFDDKAADVYGAIRADLFARGLPIGPNDMMIASIALVNNLTLVTH